jgi:putative hydrolase of the HAD superfamily
MKGVFFDLFGTLFIYTNSRKAWEDWLSVLYTNFKEFGYKKTRDSFAIECDGIMNKPEPNHDKLELTIFEQRIYDLAIDLSLDIELKDIIRISNEAVNAWQEYVPLDPEAVPVLNALKERKILALISNFDHPPHIYSLLSKFKLKQYFDSIVISSEVGVKKPNPLIFASVLEQTNIEPNDICYVGDTIDDVHAAINAKMQAILIRRQIDPEDELLLDYSTEKSFLNNKISEIDIKNVKVITSLKELISMV